jgi:hypothetical protein
MISIGGRDLSIFEARCRRDFCAAGVESQKFPSPDFIPFTMASRAIVTWISSSLAVSLLKFNPSKIELRVAVADLALRNALSTAPPVSAFPRSATSRCWSLCIGVAIAGSSSLLAASSPVNTNADRAAGSGAVKGGDTASSAYACKVAFDIDAFWKALQLSSFSVRDIAKRRGGILFDQVMRAACTSFTPGKRSDSPSKVKAGFDDISCLNL